MANDETESPAALPGAALLRDWRTTADKTQTDLAFLVGSNASRISDLERGAAIPTVELAVRIETTTEGAVPVHAWVRPEFARLAPAILERVSALASAAA
jgi:transcriptional regulator with XRE-family HTH domain